VYFGKLVFESEEQVFAVIARLSISLSAFLKVVAKMARSGIMQTTLMVFVMQKMSTKF